MPERLPDGFEVLFTKEEVQEMIFRIAKEIVSFCRVEDISSIVLVYTLKGSIPFTTALMYQIKDINPNIEIRYDILMIDSYGKERRPKQNRTIKLHMKAEMIRGQVVILTDDTRDKGGTFKTAVKEANDYGALLYKTAALLQKDNNAEQVMDFVGATIPDNYWVEGFGLGGGKDGERNRDRRDIIYCEK